MSRGFVISVGVVEEVLKRRGWVWKLGIVVVGIGVVGVVVWVVIGDYFVWRVKMLYIIFV